MADDKELIATVRRAIEEIREAVERDDLNAIDELLDQLELALPPDPTAQAQFGD